MAVVIRAGRVLVLAALTAAATCLAADNGKVKVTYRNSTGTLKVLTTGGNLVFCNSNCPGIHSGDHAALSASYLVAPKQTITSP
jgi:hypothetical protein